MSLSQSNGGEDRSTIIPTQQSLLNSTEQIRALRNVTRTKVTARSSLQRGVRKKYQDSPSLCHACNLKPRPQCSPWENCWPVDSSYFPLVCIVVCSSPYWSIFSFTITQCCSHSLNSRSLEQYSERSLRTSEYVTVSLPFSSYIVLSLSSW